MSRAQLEVQDIVRTHGDAFLASHPQTSSEQRRALRAIGACRTAVLGGHLDVCNACGATSPSYNSCRSRHCNKCLVHRSADWLRDRERDLLPVEYFHVVFTLPEELRALVLQNQRALYGLLFSTTWKTLSTIAIDKRHLGADIGALMVLHTWGQNLMHHPHVHCIVPGGGVAVDGDGKWVSCRKGFFLPVPVLRRLFRRLFLDGLVRLKIRGELVFAGQLHDLRDDDKFYALIRELRKKEWVVYAKRPFGGPEQVLRYLARYTHRVAISNARLLSLTDGKVSFRYQDYRCGQESKVMTLDAAEFLRRYLLHVVPKGFQRVRYVGLLANSCRKRELVRARELLEAEAPVQKPKEPRPERKCPVCGAGHLVKAEILHPLPRPRLDTS